MRKILKMVGIASALVILLVVSISSVVMAAGPNPAPGTCPNPECPGVCPNPDCTCDGDSLQFQYKNGPQGPNGGVYKYLYKYGQVD
jgi:hypothetical protein